MGFFKDLKEDLALAVSEFAGEEKINEEETVDEYDVFSAAEESMGITHPQEDEPKIEEALESFLDQVAANAEEAEEKYEEIPVKNTMPLTEEMNFAAKAAKAKAAIAAIEEKAEAKINSSKQSFGYVLDSESSYGDDAKNDSSESKTESSYREEPISENSYTYEPKMETSYTYEQARTSLAETIEIQPTDELAVITTNMSVNGDMASTGSLDIMGSVTGNIKVLGELNISGAVNGNCEAANIVATNCTVNGDLRSGGAIKIGSKAVIKGNIVATSAVISGAVKGDIDVRGPVILDSTAIVMGNIKSKAVQINSGAAVEGMCSQCYAEVSPSAFFRD